MPDSIHTLIEQARKNALPDPAQIKAFRDYARGRQRTTLNAGQQRILRGLLGHLFCDNICKMVLQAVGNRLELARFEVPTEAVVTYLETLWTLSRLPTLSAAVHWATLRDGNHAVALGWTDGRVTLRREPWWNGKYGVFVAYDDADRVAYAVKDWRDGTVERRTIWWPDRIERYRADANGWQPYRLPSDGEQWPMPWVDTAGQALGVPVVHFANTLIPNDGQGDGADDEPDGHYGMSELDGGVLGLQDEINDLHRDISAAARFAGYQMLYGTGITPQTGDDGGDTPLRVEPGAFFSEPNPAARFGTLPAGSLAELERAINLKLRAVSRMTDVPQHQIAGEWPSGEALLRAEMGLIEKVEKLGQSIGPAWASVAHKAVRLSNVFGGTSLDETALITTVFAPVARRDPLTMADIATTLAPLVSEREVLRILGYGPKDIDRILAERASERQARSVTQSQPQASTGAA